MPAAAREHLEESLLGRLRLKAYEVITGQKGVQPKRAEEVRRMLDEFRTNWQVGLIWNALLTLDRSSRVSTDELPPTNGLARALEQLESRPQRRLRFIELAGTRPLGATRPDVIGVFVHAEPLRPSGQVYVMTFLSEEGFPDRIEARLEVRAWNASPEPAFSVLTADGEVNYSRNTYERSVVTRLAARILIHVADQRLPWKLVPMSAERAPRMPPELIPPVDVHLRPLIRDVAARRIKLYCTRVPLETIVPSDLDFALSCPMNVVEQLIRDVDDWNKLPLLVYWNGRKFVMSDDYISYLAHRKLNTLQVPCVVLGPYPTEIARPEREGYIELMPPALAMETLNVCDLHDDVKNWLLDGRLSGRRFEAPGALVDAFLTLARLLGDPHVTERQIHEAIRQQPLALESVGVEVRSEVRLGSSFRVDLAIRDNALDRSAVLVELEHPRDKIFDRFGRLRKKVTHASQQVEDWLRWWRDHPTEVPRGFRSDLTPEGLVVIGRDASIDGELRARLEHLNQNRRVKVVTYDELLKRLTNLIVRIGQSES